MKLRLALLALLIALDVLVVPAVARLPEYLALTPGQSERLAAWQEEWLYRPAQAARTILRPQTTNDQRAREGWLWLQVIMALPTLLVVWPGTGAPSVRRRGVPPPDLSGAHGTARWRKPQELTQTLLPVHVGRRQPVRVWRRNPVPGLLAGVDRAPPERLHSKSSRFTPSWHCPRTAYLVPGPTARAPINPHVLVLGSSGAGKTRRLVLPNLWLLGQAKAAGAANSIIATDPKGELFKHTARYFTNLGYKVRTLNLLDPRRSHPYDPIREIVAALERGDKTDASDAAWDAGHLFSTIEANRYTREDAIWRQGSQSLIAASILYVAAHAPSGQKTMATVYRLISQYGQDGGELLHHVFNSIRDIADPARLAYAVTGVAQDRTRASILATVVANLRLFADPNVAALTNRSGYDLASVGQEPTVVYLLLPDARSDRNGLAAMYLAQTYSALTRLAEQNAGGRLPVPTFWILDEFANLGQFREFDKWIAVMRGRGMAAMIVLQALEQLAARYGPEVARIITANCDTWLYLRTNDRLTAREISDKLGQYTIRTETGSATLRRWDVSQGTSEHLTGRPLQTPDEILRWPMGSVLLMQAGQHPAGLRLADVDLWPASFAEGPLPPQRTNDPPQDKPWLPEVVGRVRRTKPGNSAEKPKKRKADTGADAEAAATGEPAAKLQDLSLDDNHDAERR